MSELDSIIGSSLSLISQLDIRYDGILFSINSRESSIVLREVKCMGTEDRVTDPSKKVLASEKITPFITFPANEIKDLFVHETPEPALPAPPTLTTPPPPTPGPPASQQQSNKSWTAPTTSNKPSVPASAAANKSQSASKQQNHSAQAPLSNDSRSVLPVETSSTSDVTSVDKKSAENSSEAILESKKAVFDKSRNSDESNRHHSGRGSADGKGHGKRYPDGGRGQGEGNRSFNENAKVPNDSSRTSHDRERKQNERWNSNLPSTTAGTGEHLLKSRELKSTATASTDSAPTDVKSEFDFAVGLKTFNKEAIFAEVVSTNPRAQDVSKYNKDDFFDSFSNDKADGRPGRMSYAEERKLNQDTFGISSLRNGRGGYRGGGRGGGYRGRGGYNHGRSYSKADSAPSTK